MQTAVSFKDTSRPAKVFRAFVLVLGAGPPHAAAQSFEHGRDPALRLAPRLYRLLLVRLRTALKLTVWFWKKYCAAAASSGLAPK
jgi:hypothetical protein